MKYSQIHEPSTRPIHKGWYPATDWDIEHISIMHQYCEFHCADIDSIYWWYWTGEFWGATESDTDSNYQQDKWWFGICK